MKKILVRVLAMTLVLMTMFTLCSAAFANTVTYEAGSDAPDFGESVAFYVKTTSSGTHQVKAVFGTGYLSYAGCCSTKCRCSYEAIVYFKNDSGNWQWESQYTCYNTGSKTLTLKEHSENYKIVIRAKTASVVWNSYVKNGIVDYCSGCKNPAMWSCVVWNKVPQVQLKTVKNVGTITK